MKITTQVLLHCLLLGIAGTSLPFYVDYARSVVPEGSPTFWVLSLAVFTVGPSFFMISSTAPMLQRWFSRTRHTYRDNPYFLFAASNLGSMLALLGFPTIIEPSLGVQLQTSCWQTGYYLLQALFLATGLVTMQKMFTGQELSLLPHDPPRTHNGEISASRRLSWVFLAFIPSSMMLGMTSHVTTDITPVAMFWIVPLALYLLSFVIVFSRYQHILPPRWLAASIIISSSALIFMRFAGYDKTISTALVVVILNLILFFLSAWLFHGYLSSSKPATRYLTEFYLWMSIGGMLGGFFNALVAPIIFNQVYEYYVIVVTIILISFRVLLAKPDRDRQGALNTPGILAMMSAFGVLLLIFLLVDMIMGRPITVQVQQTFIWCSLGVIITTSVCAYYKPGIMPLHMAILVIVLGVVGNILLLTQTHSNILLARSFYGALKVKLKLDINDVPYHLFIHGSTRHNLQKFGPDLAENQKPLMYFHRQANIGHAVTSMQAYLNRPLHLGFVGLGAGAMSAYAQVGDTVSYYEIDPEVVAMAQNRALFTYVSEAKGNVEIIVGDARLQLKKAKDSFFDILLIDAFSSDAIPVHLLTTEAVALYLRKIKDDGVLIFHLSNRYLDLYKVLQGIHLPKGYAVYYASKNNVERPAEVANGISGLFSHSQVVLIAKETALPETITEPGRWGKLEFNSEFKTWTDDFSNVFGVLRFF
ncbi:MAG: fused MFS/spermidine synthase [Pseudomonadota bacterium]